MDGKAGRQASRATIERSASSSDQIRVGVTTKGLLRVSVGRSAFKPRPLARPIQMLRPTYVLLCEIEFSRGAYVQTSSARRRIIKPLPQPGIHTYAYVRAPGQYKRSLSARPPAGWIHAPITFCRHPKHVRPGAMPCHLRPLLDRTDGRQD